ncbi:MAG: SMP-30/gluconolactonase/LRE family protein [Terriglobia bacterium]
MNPIPIADYKDLCGEAPLWDIQRNSLYWTDCAGLKFYRYDWASKTSEVVKGGLEINGCALSAEGGFVITNNSGIWLWDGGNHLQLVAEQVEGSPCRMNDCIADPAGRLLAGSWFYDPAQEYPLGKLICVDHDHSARILDEGFQLSNGLAFSPEGRTLYFADSAARLIFSYDYDIAQGTVKNRRVFARISEHEGIPDGLTVDSEGYVWSAQWYGSCIVRYDPDGKVERRVPTPAKQTSSLAFGGPALTDIFVTTAAQSEPMPVMPTGYDSGSGYFGGALFHMNLGIAGKPEFRAEIRLLG